MPKLPHKQDYVFYVAGQRFDVRANVDWDIDETHGHPVFSVEMNSVEIEPKPTEEQREEISSLLKALR